MMRNSLLQVGMIAKKGKEPIKYPLCCEQAKSTSVLWNCKQELDDQKKRMRGRLFRTLPHNLDEW